MNVAPDQTIILGLQIFLGHRSLSSIDLKILMATPPTHLPNPPFSILVGHWRSYGCLLSRIHHNFSYYLSVLLFFVFLSIKCNWFFSYFYLSLFSMFCLFVFFSFCHLRSLEVDNDKLIMRGRLQCYICVGMGWDWLSQVKGLRAPSVLIIVIIMIIVVIMTILMGSHRNLTSSSVFFSSSVPGPIPSL